MIERHPRRKPYNRPYTRSTRTKDKIVGDVLWCVRSLRLEHAELTVEAIHKHWYAQFRQYTIEEVQEAVSMLDHRGIKWNMYYDGIPDMCIIVQRKG